MKKNVKSVMCLGLTDKVYLKRKDKKPLGHVFFFDVDKLLEMKDRSFLFYASMKHKAQFFVLKTSAGFHVVSFKVFRPYEYLRLWSDFMENYPDTDYRYDVSNKILRLSEKGKSPKPEFVMCMGTNESNVSSGHVSAYVGAGIIRQEDVNGDMKKTFCRLMFYESKKRFR